VGNLKIFLGFYIMPTHGWPPFWNKKVFLDTYMLSPVIHAVIHAVKYILGFRAWVGNLKQRVPITSKSSKFQGVTQPYVVKLPKSAGARKLLSKNFVGANPKFG
jgi:hypothetical protein